MKIHTRISNKITKHATYVGVKSLNKLNLPNALLLIPDGNRRWAREKGLEASRGHWAGGDTIVNMLRAFKDIDIKVIGLWAFSEDNWKREKNEIDNIMAVVKDVTLRSLKDLKKNEIKFLVLGKKEKIKIEYPEVFAVLENAQKETVNNKRKTFAVFLDYGERYQLEEFAKQRDKNKKLPTYEVLSKINSGLPLFDMIFRTSGEQRTSGFGPLATLAEFVSVKKNLPDITSADIVSALTEYSTRQRRLGGN